MNEIRRCRACGAKCPAGVNCNEGCCWAAQYSAAKNKMEPVLVANSPVGTCSGHDWQRQ